MTDKKASKIILGIVFILIIAAVIYFTRENGEGSGVVVGSTSEVSEETTQIDMKALIEEKDLSTIYLAGGCFWGVEEYMSRIAGVYDASSGYANGTTENPTYSEVINNNTGHAETVKVVYDSSIVSLDELLVKFFLVIDPTSLNKQGNDAGTQYRTGIYYTDESEKAIIDMEIEKIQAEHKDPIVVEVLPLENFYDAEEYHQDYLVKNPNGYCHINLNAYNQEELIEAEHYIKPDEEEIKEDLSALEYKVTQEDGTEAAFSSPLDKNYDPGIYVDIVTGEPLFSSNDKYNSGTGWPSFTKPISEEVVVTLEDEGLFGGRTEVRSRVGDSHLGHVFTDGPKEHGGLRYCMNGAALKFIPYEEMTQEGYGHLKHIIE